MIDHIQFQAALAALIVRIAAAFEFILPAAHYHQAQIAAPQHPIKAGRLHIGFQHDLFLSGKCAVRGVRQHLHPAPLPLRFCQRASLAGQRIPYRAISQKTGRCMLSFPPQFPLPRLQSSLLRLQRFSFRRRSFPQLCFQCTRTSFVFL